MENSRNQTAQPFNKLSLAGADSVILTISEGNYSNFAPLLFPFYETAWASKTTVRVQKGGVPTDDGHMRIAFVKMFASDSESDIVAGTVLSIANHFNLRVRVAPTRTSEKQEVFFVYPEDDPNVVKAKAASPARPDETPLAYLLLPSPTA